MDNLGAKYLSGLRQQAAGGSGGSLMYLTAEESMIPDAGWWLGLTCPWWGWWREKGRGAGHLKVSSALRGGFGLPELCPPGFFAQIIWPFPSMGRGILQDFLPRLILLPTPSPLVHFWTDVINGNKEAFQSTKSMQETGWNSVLMTEGRDSSPYT